MLLVVSPKPVWQVIFKKNQTWFKQYWYFFIKKVIHIYRYLFSAKIVFILLAPCIPFLSGNDYFNISQMCWVFGALLTLSPHLHNSQESGSLCVADEVSTPQIRYHVSDYEHSSPEPWAVVTTSTSKETSQGKVVAKKNKKFTKYIIIKTALLLYYIIMSYFHEFIVKYIKYKSTWQLCAIGQYIYQHIYVSTECSPCMY